MAKNPFNNVIKNTDFKNIPVAVLKNSNRLNILSPVLKNCQIVKSVILFFYVKPTYL